jgi:hypothetical protein
MYGMLMGAIIDCITGQVVSSRLSKKKVSFLIDSVTVSMFSFGRTVL